MVGSGLHDRIKVDASKNHEQVHQTLTVQDFIAGLDVLGSHIALCDVGAKGHSWGCGSSLRQVGAAGHGLDVRHYGLGLWMHVCVHACVCIIACVHHCTCVHACVCMHVGACMWVCVLFACGRWDKGHATLGTPRTTTPPPASSARTRRPRSRPRGIEGGRALRASRR